MADFFVVIGVLAFFALCVAFVYGCDRMIGPDDQSDLAIDAIDAIDDSTESASSDGGHESVAVG
jgi:hypothetical protein